jgi:hypothetical protein
MPTPTVEVATQMAAPHPLIIYAVIALVVGGFVAAVNALMTSLSKPNSGWSLAAALSEPSADGHAPASPSSSRLIAFLGSLAILSLFMGFGVFVLWDIARNDRVPTGMGEVVQYLMTGLTLFAPYAFNKVSQVMAGK